MKQVFEQLNDHISKLQSGGGGGNNQNSATVGRAPAICNHSIPYIKFNDGLFRLKIFLPKFAFYVSWALLYGGDTKWHIGID